MNARQFLLALEQTDEAWIQQAGLAGGHFAAGKTKSTRRVVRRILLAAAVVVVLSASVFAAGKLMGVWNDKWLYTPAPEPESVVREAISRQAEKDYTRFVSVEEITVDDEETQKVLAADKSSMLAALNGSGGLEELSRKQPGEVLAVYARYAVEYDHEKTFYRDGTLYQYFYLVKNGNGDWDIFDSTDARELTPAVNPEETAEQSTPVVRDYDEAVRVVTDTIKKWEEFDDVERIYIDAAAYDPAQTEAALRRLSGTTLALGNGWTDDYLKCNMAAITVTYTTIYAADPELPDGGKSTETATYWLLRDVETGEWYNSEITGIMDAAGQ